MQVQPLPVQPRASIKSRMNMYKNHALIHAKFSVSKFWRFEMTIFENTYFKNHRILPISSSFFVLYSIFYNILE